MSSLTFNAVDHPAVSLTLRLTSAGVVNIKLGATVSTVKVWLSDALLPNTLTMLAETVAFPCPKAWAWAEVSCTDQWPSAFTVVCQTWVWPFMLMLTSIGLPMAQFTGLPATMSLTVPLSVTALLASLALRMLSKVTLSQVMAGGAVLTITSLLLLSSIGSK